MSATDFTELGKEVAIDSVEKELRILWELDEASTKASLINFAIFSENQNALIDNSRRVSKITREHACRVILMDVDRRQEDASIRAWVTAHCHLSHGKKSVCSEQIAFQLTGSSRGRVRHTLFSHLHSDLPLVLWWQGELGQSFDESFYSRIDRLIIDSGEWADPKAQFAKIEAALDANGSNLVVQDLSWTRTFHCRLAIAAMFDEPTAQRALPSVHKVSFELPCELVLSAKLLVAWMSEMAGWERSSDLVEVECDSYTFVKPNGGEVQVCIIATDSHEDVSCLKIEMENCAVVIDRERGSRLLRQRVIVGDEAVIDVHGPADSRDSCELVSDQLSRGGKNSLFRRVLPSFGGLL